MCIVFTLLLLLISGDWAGILCHAPGILYFNHNLVFHFVNLTKWPWCTFETNFKKRKKMAVMTQVETVTLKVKHEKKNSWSCWSQTWVCQLKAHMFVIHLGLFPHKLRHFLSFCINIDTVWIFQTWIWMGLQSEGASNKTLHNFFT